MIGAGLMHFIKPLPYLRFIPSFLPAALFIVYASGLVEILLGVGLLLNKSIARKASFGIFILMLIFLPLHTWDVFRTQPAIGSHTLANIRFPIQLLLIYLSFKLYRKSLQ
jgi:uncharacterized membrane protein